MKLEAGKFYFSREGKKIGPIVANDTDLIFPFRGGTMGGPVSSYRANGSWNADGTESRFDLMRECFPLEAVDESGAFPCEVETVSLATRLYSDDGKPAVCWDDIAAPGYERLAGILQEAHDQAAKGKGNERHANGKPFLDQPIMAIGRMCGMGFQTGQIQKKVQEATSMAARGESDAAIRELLGAINYAAAAVLLIRETKPGA